MSAKKDRIGRRVLGVATLFVVIFGIMAAGLRARKVTLTFHYEEAQKTYVPAAVEEFNKRHPNIKVEIESFPWLGSFEMMMTRFMGRKEAPMMSIHYSWAIRFAEYGFLASLNPYLHEIDLEDFWPAVTEQFKYKGEQVGLPVFADQYGYVYNGDMYKEAGLDPNNPPKDWKELAEQLKKLTKPEKNQWGLMSYLKAGDHMGAAFVNTFIRQNKGHVLDPEDYTRCTLTENAAIEGVKFVKKLWDQGLIAPSSIEYFHSEGVTAFAMGETAATMTASVLAGLILEKNPDIDLYSAPWPKGKQWKGPRSYGWGIAISARTEYKDEAWEFVKWLLSKEIVRDYIVNKGKFLGSRISVAKTHPMLGKQPYIGLIEGLTKGYSYLDPPIKQWYDVALTELDHFQTIFLGERTVEEALERASKDINKLLKEE